MINLIISTIIVLESMLLLLPIPVNKADEVITETVVIEEVMEVEEVELEIVEVEPIVELVSLGEFVLTAYCYENYHHICNNGDASVTATGTTPTENRTIAVDPSVIPYGTEVIINGNTYVAEDTGGAIKGNRIDICFASHEEALQFGKRTGEVFIKGGNIK